MRKTNIFKVEHSLNLPPTTFAALNFNMLFTRLADNDYQYYAEIRETASCRSLKNLLKYAA